MPRESQSEFITLKPCNMISCQSLNHTSDSLDLTVNTLRSRGYTTHGYKTALIAHVEHLRAIAEDISRWRARAIVLSYDVSISRADHTCCD